MTGTFTKAELLDLTGLSRPNHAFLSREELIAPVAPVSRGVTPRYSLDEVLRIFLMETLREAAGLEYATAASLVDAVRVNRAFWSALSTVGSDDEVWLSLFDGAHVDVDVQRADANSPPVALWRIADPTERSRHRTVVVIRISEDVRRILKASKDA